MDKFTFTSSEVWLIIEKHLRQQRLALFDDLRTAISANSHHSASLIEGQIQGIDWTQALPEMLWPKEEKKDEKETSKKERW